MPGHHEFPASASVSSIRRLPFMLTGQIQTQAMSHAKFVFLIALVVFFVVLFVTAYVWMRRPDFGQKGAHPIPAAPGRTVAGSDHGAPSAAWSDNEATKTAVVVAER